MGSGENAMKVLFVYTDVGSSVGYSAGIGSLSAILKKNGHSTGLIHISEDLNYPMDKQRICEDVRAFGPGLICFSITTNQWYFARIIGEWIKEEFDIPVIVGGHHPMSHPDNVIKEPWVDILCRGEGDFVLPEIVRRIEQGEGDSFAGIPNIYHKKNEQIAIEPLESWAKDLEDLPIDDREVFDYEKIINTRNGWAEVIVTRGCPYHCTYCFNKPLLDQYKKSFETTHRGKKVFPEKDFVSRRRHVDTTISMLKGLKETYPNIRYFTFVDDVMAREGQWFDEFTRRYKDEIGLPYACTSQPLLFSKKLALQLKESGCKVVKMGVEAGNEEIRKKVLKRNISNEKLIEVFTIAREFGLKPQSFNMIGIPGESITNMMETVHLNAKIKPYIVWLSTFSPYPGTEIYRECLKMDMIDESKWDEVDSYRGGSVLREEYLPSLELKKIRVLFRWILNSKLHNAGEDIYQPLVNEFRAMPEEEWLNGAVEKRFQEKDFEIDDLLRRQDVSHYVSKKYINMLWGKEYDYDLS